MTAVPRSILPLHVAWRMSPVGGFSDIEIPPTNVRFGEGSVAKVFLRHRTQIFRASGVAIEQ